MKKISLMDVKLALKDGRFRDALPLHLREDVAKYLTNPGCSCNTPLYKKILKECVPQLKEYFPGGEVTDEVEEIGKLAQNNWSVINCHVDELQKHLQKLAPGRKQLAITRFEDQVTCVINELDYLY